MKRFTSLLLTALLLLSMAPLSLAENDKAFEAYAEPVTITSSRFVDSTAVFQESDPEKKSATENRWTNAFLNELGIKLDYKWIASDEDSNTAKWSAAIASGNVPDVAYVSDSVYNMLLESGYVADMQEVFDTYASDAYRDMVTDTDIARVTFGGTMKGLPYPRAGYVASTTLWIRKDWLDKVNMSAPTNMDELIAVAKAFQENKLGGDNTIGILFGSECVNGQMANLKEGAWEGFLNGYGAYLSYWLENDDGTLTFSNTKDEMKTALLSMQKLYQDGLINKDFAVINNDVALEYLASGKAGIAYGPGWNGATSIQACCMNDSQADWISLFPVSATGEPNPIQTNSPDCFRIFVNAKCEHPEAAVKLINLIIDKQQNDYSNYFYGTDGFLWMKYIPFGDQPAKATKELDTANEIRQALLTGEKNFSNDTIATNYQSYLDSLEGKADVWYRYAYSEGGSLNVAYDAYHAGLLLENKYADLGTPTMLLKGDIINDALYSAMFEVVMGADISTYDKAIESWFANGGQQITDEVNEWWASKK